MYTKENKSTENKNRAVANNVCQKKSGAKQDFGFVDNRPEVVKQRLLQLQIEKEPKLSVVQLRNTYAKLNTQATFGKKHLHANPSQEICGAMLIARKYRRWQSSTDTHTLIQNSKVPAAAPLSGAAGRKYMSTKKVTAIDREFIASDPSVDTAGSKWTANTKNSAADVKLGGDVTPLAQSLHSNGQDNVNCSWQMSVNHLQGTGDLGLNPTTIEWLAGTNEYKVTINGESETLAKATVEQ